MKKRKFSDSHFNEYKAFEVLKQIDYEKYCNCEKYEKPDWYDEKNNFGIEVLTIIEEKVAENGSKWINDNNSTKPFINLSIGGNSIFSLIKSKLMNKNEKCDFYDTNNLELYVMFDYDSPYDYPEYDFENEIWKYFEEIDIKYKKVYFDMIDNIWIFDVKNRILNILDKEQYDEIYKRIFQNEVLMPERN